MGKVLYLSTKPPDIDAPDSNISQLGRRLAHSADLDVKVINKLSDLRGINIQDYAMIVFDPEIAIPPWELMKGIKKSLEPGPCPPFWVEGDMSEITKSYLEANHLTGTVSVTKDSKEVIAACNGKVDGQLDSDAPTIEMDTPHNICSIGKMLTGLTALQLIQDGKLKLTDRIYDYLPEDFPDREKFEAVTVAQLLTHTAGMGNYTRKYDIALRDPDMEDPQLKTLDDFVSFIDPASLSVGEYNYSNVGYVVLGKVIEEAANKGKAATEHQSYWDVVNELILQPNDIHITRDKPSSENPATNGRVKTTIKIASSPAGANMWATPAELNKFANWVMRRTQEEPTFRPQLEDLKVRIYAGEEFYYSAGIMMGKDSAGQDFYCHNGGAPGISSYLRIDPSTQMTETIFINNDSDDIHLADGLVASTLESYVMDAKAKRVYYADPKFSDNPEELFQQIAQEAGVALASTPLAAHEKTEVKSELEMKTKEEELAARERMQRFKAGIPQEAPTEPGKIILLCGTSTAGKTSICTAVQTEARKTGHEWIIDGGDIAAEKAWTEPCEIAGIRYPSAQDYLGTAMKTHADPLVVDAAISKFGARTLAAAFFSRRNLGHPKVDQVDLTLEADIKRQATKIYDALSPENQKQYTPVDIENLLIIIRDCPTPDVFLAQHPYPPLEDVNKHMLERAITRAKKGESTIFDIIGNEVIDRQRMVDQFHDRLKAAGLPAETGTVAVIHCPVATLIDRIDGRNRKAIAEDRKDDVRQAFFPFDQYGTLYEKAPALPDPTRPIVGVVTRHDITKAAHQFGRGDDDATSLLAKLGFTDGDESVSVISRVPSDATFQSGSESSQLIAESLCERAFGPTPGIRFES